MSHSNEYTLSRSGTLISEAELVQMDLTLAPPLGFEQKLDGKAMEGEDFTAAVAEVEDCSAVVADALPTEEALVVAVMVKEELTVVTAGEELVIAAPDWSPAAE